MHSPVPVKGFSCPQARPDLMWCCFAILLQPVGKRAVKCRDLAPSARELHVSSGSQLCPLPELHGAYICAWPHTSLTWIPTHGLDFLACHWLVTMGLDGNLDTCLNLAAIPRPALLLSAMRCLLLPPLSFSVPSSPAHREHPTRIAP